MKKLFYTIIILHANLLLPAQPPNLFFEKLTTENNLSNNKVNCIIRDNRGFMWIGTNDGLNRFDGNNFTIFRNKPGDSSSISGNIITGLIQDANDVLWISSADGGLCRYNFRLPPDQQFKQFKNKPASSHSIPTNSINALIDDAKGNLWLASSGFGVIRFNKESEKFERPVIPGPKTVLSLCVDNAGILWVGRQGGGLVKINPATSQVILDSRYENLYAKLPHVVVTSLYSDKEKNIWYGSWDKLLYRFDYSLQNEIAIRQNDFPNSFIDDDISCFAEDKQGYLWIGGKTKGLQLMNKKTGQFYNYSNNPLKEGTLSDNTVNCIYIDPSGKTWLGTNKGISISNPQQQQFVQTFLTVPGTNNIVTKVYDFYKDENADLWMGTSEGIFILKNNSAAPEYRQVMYNGTKLAVTKFFKDSKGVFYIGTDYSLFIYNRSANSVQLLPNTQKDQVMNKIIASRVVSIAEDSVGNHPVLLVSPYGHFLTYHDRVTQQWISRLDTSKKIIERFGLKDNLIRRFFKSSSGRIWLANAQYGLGEWKPNASEKIIYYKNDPDKNDGISNNSVYDIAEDAKNNLWISTYGGGLNYFDLALKKIQHITASNNLLEGIAVDNSGNVWMLSNGQLQCYDIKTQSITAYKLPDMEKSGGVSGYIFKDSTGKMYLAGKNYFIAFNPESVTTLHTQPVAYLTDFKIFNTSYSHLLNGNSIELSYSKNYFTIEFAAPDFSSTQPVQYSYMLEGFDKDWVETGTRNTATFSNLQGGTYFFKVRASNHTGEWGNKITTIKIVITPPLWKRWWFYVLATLIIASAVYAVYRYRINELLKRHAIRNKIAQDLHDNLGSTLSSISVYSEVAKIHGNKNEAEDMNLLLEKISDISNEMVTEMNDIVWAINPRNDSMEKIIQRMESFAKPLAAARNIRFTLAYDKAVLSHHPDMDIRKNFYLIFKEAVNNAIKYSGASELHASVQFSNHQLALTVKDNGVGFNPEREMANNKHSMAGNGLNNMYKRAAELKGILTIESNPNDGTVVYLQIPFL